METKSEPKILEKGKKYIFRVSSAGQTLNYTGKLLDFNKVFICFLDKFNKTITLNINNLISAEVVEEVRE